jgi:hypothetical protein
MENRIAGDVGDVLWFPHDPTYPLRDCLQVIGRLKEEMVTPGEAMARAKETVDAKQIAVSTIYARYEQTLREKQALIRRTWSAAPCRFSPKRRRSSAGAGAVAPCSGGRISGREPRRGETGATARRSDGSGVWCVGDLRQAIYRFRGASPRTFPRFTTDFPGGVRKDLAVNYRSRKPLVSCFGQVADKTRRLGREPGSVRPLPVSRSPSPTRKRADRRDRAEIFALRGREPGYRWRDFAVLCRTNPQAKAVRAALTRHGVPVAGGADNIAWLRDGTVRELLLLLSLTAAETQSALATRTGRTLPPYLVTKTTPADFLCAALYGASGIARAITNPRPVQTLLALAQTFGEQAAVLVGTGESANEAFLRHVRRVARLNQEPKRDSEEADSESADAVQVLTVHAAKGLEFPVVFVPNLSQGRFPPQARPAVVDDNDTYALMGDGSGNDADEEARLFFVAMTRARDYLFLSLAEKYDNRAAQPSSLLAPLGAIAEVTHVRWPVVSDEWSVVSKNRSDGGAGVGSTLATDHSSLTTDSPIPAHELERYLRCPRRYFYETRCGYGDARERTAYDALKRAVRSVLRGARAESAFGEAWSEYGLAGSDPWLVAYRKEWESVVASVQAGVPYPPPRHITSNLRKAR